MDVIVDGEHALRFALAPREVAHALHARLVDRKLSKRAQEPCRERTWKDAVRALCVVQ